MLIHFSSSIHQDLFYKYVVSKVKEWFIFNRRDSISFPNIDNPRSLNFQDPTSRYRKWCRYCINVVILTHRRPTCTPLHNYINIRRLQEARYQACLIMSVGFLTASGLWNHRFACPVNFFVRM